MKIGKTAKRTLLYGKSSAAVLDTGERIKAFSLSSGVIAKGTIVLVQPDLLGQYIITAVDCG